MKGSYPLCGRPSARMSRILSPRGEGLTNANAIFYSFTNTASCTNRAAREVSVGLFGAGRERNTRRKPFRETKREQSISYFHVHVIPFPWRWIRPYFGRSRYHRYECKPQSYFVSCGSEIKSMARTLRDRLANNAESHVNPCPTESRRKLRDFSSIIYGSIHAQHHYYQLRLPRQAVQ